jgi:hypothetical protein
MIHFYALDDLGPNLNEVEQGVVDATSSINPMFPSFSQI